MLEDDIPVLCVTFSTQEVLLFRDAKTGEVTVGAEDKVEQCGYGAIITRVESELDNETTGGWKVIEVRLSPPKHPFSLMGPAFTFSNLALFADGSPFIKKLHLEKQTVLQKVFVFSYLVTALYHTFLITTSTFFYLSQPLFTILVIRDLPSYSFDATTHLCSNPNRRAKSKRPPVRRN